jgi:hypothetical protein
MTDCARTPAGEATVRGIGVSPGVAVGPAFVLVTAELQVVELTASQETLLALRNEPAEAEAASVTYAVAGPVRDFVPVHAEIRGCPPSPADILRGILAAVRGRR